MNYIYDVVLNYSEDDLDFYEWMKEDELYYIEKIPIFKINSIQMEELMFNKIRLSKNVLNSIKNKTIHENGILEYCMLVTDNQKVLGLKFNCDGILIEKSSLLLDEEEAVIEEVDSLELDFLDYEVLDESKNILFMTRYEKNIRSYLLDKINNLYDNKVYDEIDYLYYEIYNNNCSINKEYKILIDNIKNNFNSKLCSLYDIIKLSEKVIN